MSTNAELTRERLGNALKEELRTTPLTKVTVRRLTEIAGVTRQAFYYHFPDVMSLATWVFEREIVTHIMAHATYREWSDGFCELLVYMSEHREQTYAVVSSLSRSEIEEFFYRAFREMMRAIISELEGSAPLDPAQRDFIIDHFTLSVVAHLFHWLNRDMQADPYILTENIEVIMRGSVATALDRYSTDAPPPLTRREGKH
jgi:possible transcriptional regulator